MEHDNGGANWLALLGCWLGSHGWVEIQEQFDFPVVAGTQKHWKVRILTCHQCGKVRTAWRKIAK